MSYYASSKTNSISGQLIGSLSDKATNADTKAQSALEKSDTAETKADGAAKKADLAETKIEAVDKASGKALERAQAADRSLADFQARLAWRTVSEQQKQKLRDELQEFRGRTVQVSWDELDPESNTFAPELIDALRYAGLTVNPTPAVVTVLSPNEMSVLGLLLEGNDKIFEERLAKALICTSLANAPISEFLNGGGTSVIRIRPKDTRPMTAVDKKRLASLCP